MKISDIFELIQGNSLNFKDMIVSDESVVNFISRTSKLNGVVGKVNEIDSVIPFSAGLITVALGGSVLSSFVQTKPFYTAYHIMVLKPKIEMSLNEKLFYCMCINKNAYRYSYGRQANKTLKDIKIPNCVPEQILNLKIDTRLLKSSNTEQVLLTKSEYWEKFTINFLFEIVNGVKLPSYDRKFGTTPLVSTTSQNNGVSDYIDSTGLTLHSNILTVAYSGSVGATFYHEGEVFVGETVFALIPKFKMNKYIAQFLVTVLTKNNERYTYGRKIIGSRYGNDEILLPSKDKTMPDWEYIEYYIKSLSFGDKI